MRCKRHSSTVPFRPTASVVRPGSVPEAGASGFTIIELLVVISIITLLISITLPSLQKSKETTRRTICMTNSRSQAQACNNYSVNNKDYFPPANGIDPAHWAYSFDIRASGSGLNPRIPLGVGLTLAGGFFDVQPSALHCPSLNTTNSPVTPYHSMDVNSFNWWNSVGASWWNDPAYVTYRITIGYTYRAQSWYRTNATNKQIRVGMRPPQFVVNADILDTRFGMKYAHRDGYTFSRLDQSADWRPDPEGTFEAMAGVVVDGMGIPAVDEALFKRLENNN